MIRKIRINKYINKVLQIVIATTNRAINSSKKYMINYTNQKNFLYAFC